MTKKLTALIILDGFGYSKETAHNAIAQAKTPHLDAWFSEYPHALLQAAGTAVGLPQGFIGNSEVGHSTIGAGRIIKQPVTAINEAIENNSFFTNPTLIDALKKLKQTEGTLHLIGLLSDAGVHGHIAHLFAFIDAAIQQGVQKIVVHPILDGRDTLPRSAEKYLNLLSSKINHLPQITIGSLQGRYYAMDRDNNWDRTQKSYNTLTINGDEEAPSWQQVIERAYKDGLTDEFIPPISLGKAIAPGDGIIFFNFRPERMRQLVQPFADPAFNYFDRPFLSLAFILAPVDYHGKKHIQQMFSFPTVEHTLLDQLQADGYSLFTIAETEKYAHVTYFFSGGKETQRANETRVLIPSIKTRTYEAYPCMSAVEITDTVINSLKTKPCDFYLINYANADMVAHSGNMQATVKAIECLDKELGRLYEQLVKKMDGTMFVTADHGNAEEMFDADTGQVKTAHTTNPVPFMMITRKDKGHPKQLPFEGLKDIARFLLRYLGLEVPGEMG